MAVLPTKGVPMGRSLGRPIAPVSKPMLGGRPLVGPIQAGTVNPGLNALRRAAAASRAGSMQRAFTPTASMQASGMAPPQQKSPGRLLGNLTQGPPRSPYPRNGGFPGAQKPRLTPGSQLKPVTNPLVPRRPNPGNMIPGYRPGMVPPPRKNPRQFGPLNQGLGFPGQHTGPGGVPIDERFSFPGQITGRGGVPIDERFARGRGKGTRFSGNLTRIKPKPKPKKPIFKPKPKPGLTKAQRRARAFKAIRQGKQGRRGRQVLAKKRGRLKGGPRSDLSISPELLRRIARQQIGRQ